MQEICEVSVYFNSGTLGSQRIIYYFQNFTYLCESSNSDGVDQFVKKKDHLLPVVNKSAKFARSCRKGC